VEHEFTLVEPRIPPVLDPGFRPAVLANRSFLRDVAASGHGSPFLLALERGDGSVARFATVLFSEEHARSRANLRYAERLLKFLLWQKGGYRVYVAGPTAVVEHLKHAYSPTGERAFDFRFMGEEVCDKTFAVVHCDASEVPPVREKTRPLGRHLAGCRIGFDLGASDRKVSALIDGRTVFSEETVWAPREQGDPDYHYREIMAALRRAAEHLPRVDAVGGSAAGVYVDNRVRVASLFRGVASARYDLVRDLFVRIREEMGVPLEIVNDGEVAALAGSMSLDDNAVLGIALGSSEAAGYVTPDGNITGWLNELAFAPVDLNPGAPVDEWSGDRGCGALYFSQQCVFRLASRAGISLPAEVSAAEQLAFVQRKLAAGHEGAVKIWQTIGTYMGYAIAHYADFYDLKHVLLLGRCTSGQGGALILEHARAALDAEFPDLADRLTLHLPDEKTRRVGQAVAAASLPMLSPEE
jgi:predicted NBD/HSP70 family sugar kinase